MQQAFGKMSVEGGEPELHIGGQKSTAELTTVVGLNAARLGLFHN